MKSVMYKDPNSKLVWVIDEVGGTFIFKSYQKNIFASDFILNKNGEYVSGGYCNCTTLKPLFQRLYKVAVEKLSY